MSEPAYGTREKRALVAVAAQFWINGLVFSSFIPRLPEIRDRIEVGLGTMGLLLALAAFGGVIGSTLTATVIEQFGTRATMIGGAALSLLVLPVIGFATAPWVFLAGMLWLQLTDVLADVAVNMQGSRLSNLRPTPVMNRLHGLWSVGTVMGGLAATQLARFDVSLGAHLIGVSVVLAATLVAVGPRLLPDGPTAEGSNNTAEGDGGDRASSHRRLNSTMLAFAGLAAAAMVMEAISGDWAAFRLADDLGLADGPAGYGYVAFTVGMVIGRLGGDAVLGRIGGDSMLRLAVAVASAGMAIAALLPTQTPGAATIVVAGYGIAGLGVAVLFPRLYDEAAQAPGRKGAAMGALTAGQRIVMLIAPTIVGLLAGTRLSVGTSVALVLAPCALVLMLVHVGPASNDAAGHRTSTGA